MPTPTIDGVRAETLVTPLTAAELAAALAEAAANGLAVTPIGGGSALALGNPPERVDLAISTAALDQIIDYEPTDMTLSVGAGARFGSVLAALGEHGQTLPLDVAQPERATIGGLVATALAGPWQLGAGSLRDLLIGMAVALPNGAVTKSGGMVVKNVTGFDLPRLYHGSLGTLGIISSVNFKVLPLPRADATVVAAQDSLAAALVVAGEIRRQRLLPAALEVFWQDGAWWLAARFTGREPSVAQRLAQTSAIVRHDAETMLGEHSRRWWQVYMDTQALDLDAPDEVLVRWSVRPSGTDALTRQLIELMPGDGPDRIVWLGASTGLGVVTGRLRLAPRPEAAAPLAGLQRQWQELADHVQILAAAPVWKHGIDVWGESPATLDLMRGLKEQFDPDRVLNPGRFAGHI